MERDFTLRVQNIVRAIPKGATMTYGQVAKAAGRQGAARAVGTIMARNSDKSIPCHRVILASGKAGGYNNINGPSKTRLLRKEGARVK